jgi:2-polyprenyl-3-methyl-5-hydroxy-6-metoxy-1,4-benzoquinol methylase
MSLVAGDQPGAEPSISSHYASRTDAASQSSPGEVTAGMERWLAATGPADPLVDVGSGIGANLATLAGAGRRVVGVEIALAAARQAAGLAPVVVADGSALPFRSGVFGGGTCTEVLEHVADPGAVLAELARVVSPGGLAYVTTPNYSNLAGIHKWWADRRSGAHDWNPWGAHAGGYEAFMTGRALARHAAAHLDVVSVRGLDFGQALTGRFALTDRAAASRRGQKVVVPLLQTIYRRAARWPFRWHGMHVELVLRSRPGA